MRRFLVSPFPARDPADAPSGRSAPTARRGHGWRARGGAAAPGSQGCLGRALQRATAMPIWAAPRPPFPPERWQCARVAPWRAGGVGVGGEGPRRRPISHARNPGFRFEPRRAARRAARPRPPALVGICRGGRPWWDGQFGVRPGTRGNGAARAARGARHSEDDVPRDPREAPVKPTPRRGAADTPGDSPREEIGGSGVGGGRESSEEVLRGARSLPCAQPFSLCVAVGRPAAPPNSTVRGAVPRSGPPGRPGGGAAATASARARAAWHAGSPAAAPAREQVAPTAAS